MTGRNITTAVAVVLISISASSKEIDSAGVERCRAAMSSARPAHLTSSFTDGNKNYFMFDAIEFGEYDDGQAFISLHGRTIKTSQLTFRLPDGTVKSFLADAVPMKQAAIYRLPFGKRTTYCIKTPTSGLGMSGRFQHYVYLFEFDDVIPLTNSQGIRAALVESAGRGKSESHSASQKQRP